MTLSGAVDAVLGRFVVGWVHDDEDPGRRVEVEIQLDGEPAGAAVAALERGDLVLAAIGDGCHGFRVELARALEPGREHELAVRTTREGQLLPLANDFMVESEAGQPATGVVVSTPRPVRARAPDPAGEAPEPPGDELPPALVGAQGWLYELLDLDQLQPMLGRRRLGPERVAAHRAALLERYARVTEHDAVYFPAIVPAKMTLYSQHLPAELQPIWPNRAARLVAATLRDVNGLELFDLLAPLRDATGHGELFARAATELSWTGAFHAYRALAKDLAKRWPALEPLAVRALRLGEEAPIAGSLASRPRYALIGGQRVAVMPDGEPAATEAQQAGDGLSAVFAPLDPTLEQQLGPAASLLEVSGAGLRETAVIVHSGRGGRVATLLAEHFARTLIAGGGEVPYDAVGGEGAAVVIELIDEASLCG